MIKKEILSLGLCAGFIMSLNTCCVNNKASETFGKSSSVSMGLANEEFANYLTKMESLESVEKEINDEVIERKAYEEKERKAHVCFNSYDIGIPSGITREEIAAILNHSNYANFLEFSDAFVDAEKEYKVNAFALVAISGTESRWNKSERANDGSNNITGMDVQSDISKGTIYNTKYDCIMDLARQLRLYYLTPGSCYYSGVSTSKVNIYYSADAKWYKTIDKIGDELVFEYNRLHR